MVPIGIVNENQPQDPAILAAASSNAELRRYYYSNIFNIIGNVTFGPNMSLKKMGVRSSKKLRMKKCSL